MFTYVSLHQGISFKNLLFFPWTCRRALYHFILYDVLTACWFSKPIRNLLQTAHNFLPHDFSEIAIQFKMKTWLSVSSFPSLMRTWSSKLLNFMSVSEVFSDLKTHGCTMTPSSPLSSQHGPLLLHVQTRPVCWLLASRWPEQPPRPGLGVSGRLTTYSQIANSLLNFLTFLRNTVHSQVMSCRL